jgi:hypothetical protein
MLMSSLKQYQNKQQDIYHRSQFMRPVQSLFHKQLIPLKL